MLNFITGRAGTGKTTLIRQKIAEIIETTNRISPSSCPSSRPWHGKRLWRNCCPRLPICGWKSPISPD
ncbi:MAG: hypothetical protein IKI93_17910 [Clostridia bacterium]|nr:hypothetical protein [Clostridia bacterium]